jgi:hypothetical protein
MFGCMTFSLIDFRMALSTFLPIAAAVFFMLTLISEHVEKKEIKSV